ncbi:hypothetical protein C8J56DRAFT_8587 [Mycena floridula]|nr:hypothetical protein C8J56DRAFT_8587 [Mycena floridula]
MWQLFACNTRAEKLGGLLWARVRQVISYSEYFKPYMTCYRVRTIIEQPVSCSRFFLTEQDATQMSHLKVNEAYVASHPLESDFDRFLVNAIENENSRGYFYSTLSKLMEKKDAAKFSQEAYDVLGECAVAHEFWTEFWTSTAFRISLRAYGLEKMSTQDGFDGMLRRLSCLRIDNYDRKKPASHATLIQDEIIALQSSQSMCWPRSSRASWKVFETLEDGPMGLFHVSRR